MDVSCIPWHQNVRYLGPLYLTTIKSILGTFGMKKMALKSEVEYRAELIQGGSLFECILKA